jgi:hypothetical protein
MDVSYTLVLEDHLAWYDYHSATPAGTRLRSPFPFVEQFRRWRFSRQVISPPSSNALGERTLEATEKGLREFSPKFNFTTAWADMGLVAVTSSHLFLAHKSMNAHIVPLRFFKAAAERESFVTFARGHVT